VLNFVNHLLLAFVRHSLNAPAFWGKVFAFLHGVAQTNYLTKDFEVNYHRLIFKYM
jgi:hypothetical protein